MFTTSSRFIVKKAVDLNKLLELFVTGDEDKKVFVTVEVLLLLVASNHSAIVHHDRHYCQSTIIIEA